MKFLRLALCALLLAGCAGTPSIDDSYTARGQSSRVQYIVLHYTSTDFTRSLALLTVVLAGVAVLLVVELEKAIWRGRRNTALKSKP